jgi:hypothetical protein
MGDVCPAEDIMAIDERADVRQLRAEIYGAGREPTRDDLARLIAGNSSDRGAEFAELLAEVGLDVLVRQADPPGYMSDDDALWLAQRIHEGSLDRDEKFALLSRLAGHSVSVPPAMTAFAVHEVAKAILDASAITAADVEALRAVSFAPTRGHSLHVDRATAETLFEIAHAIAESSKAPEFSDFFAKAIGNYLMGVDFLGTPDAEDVRQTEAELDRPDGGLAGFLSTMFRGRPDIPTGLEAIGEAQEAEDRAINAETDSLLEAQSHIGDEAGRWVIDHLTREGELSAAERRLLAFLRDEAASAPPALTALYARAA